MARCGRGEAKEGSRKWLQKLVNEHYKVIDQRLRRSRGLNEICWRSPLEKDNYLEYSGSKFIKKLGVDELEPALSEFWPGRNAPCWDALAKASQGRIIIVEAKSHIGELGGRPCRATSERSKNKIQASLGETKRYLEVCSDVDWAKTEYYQYANRLAHLYFLHKHNHAAYLLYIYFMNDTQMGGPRTQSEWECAVKCMRLSLGIPKEHRLSKYILNEFIDVRGLTNQK